MQKQPLEVRSESVDELTRIYRLSGDLFGFPKGYTVQDAIRSEIAEGAKRVVIDLSAVNRIDSSGIGILVTLMWSASQAGGGLVLTALPPRVEKVLSIAMLLDHIDHADSIEEALTKLTKLSQPQQ